MTLGVELGKAYLTALVQLPGPGRPLVSALDNGRIQLWRDGARVREVEHAGLGPGKPGPVCCLAALPSGPAASPL